MSGSAQWWTRLLVMAAALLIAATVVLIAAGRDGRQNPKTDRETQVMPDLAETLGSFAGGLREDAPYRPPTSTERDTFLAGLRLLADGEEQRAGERLRPLGYSVTTGTDRETGRRFALAVNEPHGERAWGLYLLDLSAPPSLVVEVPHPANDLHTDQIGLALFRQVPTALLAVSGTNRRAAGGAGDVAHQTDSMFHAVATDLAGRGLPQIQLHGFHDTSLPDADVVVSPGAGEVSAPTRRAADRLDDMRFAVCRSWQTSCGRLEGTRNRQGIAAANGRTVFLHVEISRTVRADPGRRPMLARALASADLTGS